MIRLGTCSWKYPSWSGLVYSAPKGIDYLEEYARHYHTVEVDQWFWSLFAGDKVKLPDEAVVAEYRQAVGDDFRFTVKVPNSLSLTHHYKKTKSDPLEPNPFFLDPNLWHSFTDSLSGMRDVLGPLILQFEYLNKQKMTGRPKFLEQLGAFLDAIPDGPPVAVELRNPRWVDAAWFDFLRDHGASPVLLQGYWMPPVTELYGKFRQELAAHQNLVIRLHGGDRKGIEKLTKKQWDKVVQPMDGELEDVARMADDLAGAGPQVFVNVNNHYEGSAPQTIRKLQDLFRKLAG
jgi:uncharacterized protein YecE (DUF72 family)